MAAYKKHLMQTNNRGLLNVVSLYTDIDTYCNMDNSSQSQKKKQQQAELISRLVCLTKRLMQFFCWLANY